MPSSASGSRPCSPRSPGTCSADGRWRRSSAGSGAGRRGARHRRAPRSSSAARAAPCGDAPIPLEVDGRARRHALHARRRRPRSRRPPAGSCRRSRRCSPSRFDRSRLEQEALEAETLRRSDLVKTALLRAVSHDLRSPLTGITTAIGALAQRRRSSSATTTAGSCSTRSPSTPSGSARLVGDLLDLSRLEAGGAEPEAEVWALDELVREAVSDLPGSDRIDVAGEAPLVNVDPVQIQRVLANLVENALKFSPSDARVHVRITATRQEAIVRIVDQGPGLDRTSSSASSSRSTAGTATSARAPGSALRSRAGSRRRTAAASGPSRGPARARPSRSPSPSSR